MANLDNSNETLLTGMTKLLRSEVSGWSTNSEYNVSNVWPHSEAVGVEDEFPRGIVNIVDASDTDISIDGSARLREATVRLVVFSEESVESERLIDSSETAVSDHWSSYIGDWHFREFDGMTPLNEDEGDDGKLRYNRSIDMIMETVKTS